MIDRAKVMKKRLSGKGKKADFRKSSDNSFPKSRESVYFCAKEPTNSNMMKKIIYGAMLTCLCACGSSSETEKHQSSRSEVVKVKDKVKEIDTEEDVLIGRSSRPYYSEDYLIITDYEAWDGAIHLFDKKDFRYLASTGTKGPGPYELTNMGHLSVDEERRKLYVTDYGKNKVLSYDMDSVIAMSDAYRHQVKARIEDAQFPSDAIYINDTLSYGRVIQPTSFNSFDQMIGKWNMLTGEIKIIGEKHPDTHKKRSLLDVSMEKEMIVEVYINYDLMAIMDLEGRVKCYIYGPDWTKRGLQTFDDVMITPNHILAAYSGDEWARGRTDKVHVFDLKGNYVKTLDIGYDIRNCTYDKTHHRLFMIFNDEIQFGYLDLEGII